MRQPDQKEEELVQGIYRHADNLGWPKPCVLHDGPRSKKTAQGIIIHRHSDDTVKGIQLKLEHYKRPSNRDDFVSEESFTLDYDGVARLHDHLHQQEAFFNLRESTGYVLVPIDQDFVSMSDAERQAVNRLATRAIREGRARDIIALSELDSEILANLSAAAQQARYKQALAELQGLLKVNASENAFRSWFIEHAWVFGTEYLRPESPRRIGLHNELDICLTSVDGYQDVIELKLPTHEVFVYDASHKTYYPSSELSKALAQSVNYLHKIDTFRTSLAEEEKLPFLKPRARIVIGRSDDWIEEKRKALRMLNSTLANVDVMTYTHILARAQRMVGYYESLAADGVPEAADARPEEVMVEIDD